MKTRLSVESLEPRALLARIFVVGTGIDDVSDHRVSMYPYDFSTMTPGVPVVTGRHDNYMAHLALDAAPGTRHTIEFLKVSAADGLYYQDALVASLKYVAREARQHPRQEIVVAMPLAGRGTFTDYLPMILSLATLSRRGVVVSAAAGNAGADTDYAPFYPAAATAGQNVMAVAAADADGNLYESSNRGVKSVPVAATVDAFFGTSGASILGAIALGDTLDQARGKLPPRKAIRMTVGHAVPLGPLAGKVGSGAALVFPVVGPYKPL